MKWVDGIIEQNVLEILHRDPLAAEALPFWSEADDPWQALSCLLDLRAAYKNPAGPEAYESRMSVHVDGTCNGLQHYAALGDIFKLI